MASNSKSTTLYSNNGYGYTLTASFNENSTNVANNTSNITCTASFSAGGSNWSTSYASSLTIYWHDNRENYDRQVASISFTGINKRETKTASGTINVTHNDDGGLSGYAYAYFNKGSTTTGWACNSGGVATDWTALTKIDRYAITNSVTGSNIEDNFSVNYTKYINTYTYKLRISLPSTEELEKIDYNTSGETFTLQQETIDHLLDKYKNTNSFNLGFAVETWNSTGTSKLSAGNEKIITAKILTHAPTFDVAYQDTNSTTTAITGNNQQIIRNNSTLQINVTNATAYKGATLSSIKAELNGTIYNGTLNNGSATFNIGTINVSENITAVVTLTDSRGFSTNQNVNIQVLDWVLPTAIINLQRENNFYSKTNINVNAEYSSLDNKNTISIKVRYKKVSDATYSNWTTLQDDVTQQFTLDNNYEWNVQIVLEDRLGTTTYNSVLNRGIPITFFDRLKRSLGINCFPANDTSLEISGKTIFDMIYPVGSIYLTVNSTDPSTIFGGTWEQIKDQFLLSAGDTYTAGTTGGSATHTLTVDEIPSHSHRLKRNGGFTDGVMVDTGRTGQWGSAIAQVGSRDYTAQPNDITVENTGGGKAHNNMPPYLVVYVWKRTA